MKLIVNQPWKSGLQVSTGVGKANLLKGAEAGGKSIWAIHKIFWLLLIFACLQAGSVYAVSLGDRVQTTASVFVRQTAGGTPYANGQPSGALGVATSGPQYAQVQVGGTGTTYEWWYVDFDSGQDGWVAVVNCPAVVPSPPTLIYPGNGSTVPTISTLTPTFSWNAVRGATGYGLYLQQGNTYPINQDVGNTTSFTPSSGTLQFGDYYVWNMRAHDSAGYSAYSSGTSGLFYFQTPSCSYSLSPPANTGAAYGGPATSGSVTVTSTGGCTWTANNDGYSWLTITSGSSGNGNGTVYYSVAANTTGSPRQGYMNIAGQLFSVVQSSCTFTLSPPVGTNVDSSAANFSVGVSATGGCSWTADSGGASWITITSGSGGTGSGTVYYSVPANTSSSGRSANMTIAGHNFAVAQSAGSTGGSAPTITTQPQNQTVNGGNTATFSVAASGASLKYQWLFNGQIILGATSSTLTLNSVTAAKEGSYSVVVSNPYGSVTSATASLSVLTDGANGNTPVQPTRSSLPAKSSSAKNLVFITHGWQWAVLNPLGPPPQPWMAEMTNDIAQQLEAKGELSDWQFETYSWLWDAWTINPDTALNSATSIGARLGTQLAAQGWQRVHLIAHSAGAGMIQEIADAIHTNSPSTLIQMTFLDPFIGLDHWALSWYGSNATWSDDYYTAIDETSPDPVATGLPLPKAFAVDVSWVDPNHQQAQYIGPGGGPVALSSHGYPIDFYTHSIVNTDPNWSGAGYGFILSMEDDGANWINTQINNPVGSGPILPNSPANAVQNPNSGLGALESVGLGGIIIIGNGAYAVGSAVVNGAGFILNSIWSSLPLVKSGGVQPMGGPVPLGGSSSTNSPAWLAMGVPVTNAVNFVQFDAAFTDTNSAQGLLTVYWNTNQVGMVDERVAATNLQTYRFTLPGTVSSGLYTLSFRLDSFANSSSIAVTNVATGFVGMTQPITLGISITNGSPLLQLTAATNFTYLIQSSTNLVNWTPTVLILNTNGTTRFIDSAVTNSSRRFYRAVIP